MRPSTAVNRIRPFVMGTELTQKRTSLAVLKFLVLSECWKINTSSDIQELELIRSFKLVMSLNTTSPAISKCLRPQSIFRFSAGLR